MTYDIRVLPFYIEPCLMLSNENSRATFSFDLLSTVNKYVDLSFSWACGDVNNPKCWT
ncbi:hypothetical protein PLICRDRAFT_701538 [Plicaturopsis crispa FD-325 SS-3]|uniref:Uncharacterized protein n=1 Tax=Plicaturopsis crispa FD-325 SS-3 TaxID=944288 RepID=A0A0C9T987_PLICR|nr:hypothetical protein PLICRDRAFT_701538 [Plicaturopsis crispa FD-325 SS-3]